MGWDRVNRSVPFGRRGRQLGAGIGDELLPRLVANSSPLLGSRRLSAHQTSPSPHRQRRPSDPLVVVDPLVPPPLSGYSSRLLLDPNGTRTQILLNNNRNNNSFNVKNNYFKGQPFSDRTASSPYSSTTSDEFINWSVSTVVSNRFHVL